MVEKENKKVEVGKEERKEEGGNGKKRPIETVNLFTNNGMLSFSVWEGGSISVRVSKRGRKRRLHKRVEWSDQSGGLYFTIRRLEGIGKDSSG